MNTSQSLGTPGAHSSRRNVPRTSTVHSSVWILSDRPESFTEAAEELRLQLFDVRFVRDGWASYYEALVAPPSVFLVDGVFSGMDASAFCCLVSGAGRLSGIPIIYVDTEATSGPRIQALSSGAWGCIAFPFLPEELLARIRTQLHMARCLVGENKLDSGDSASRITQKAMLVINNARTSELSAKALARSIGTSARRLSHDFKCTFGVSPTEYLRREKLERAAWLLQNTGFSVMGVAREVGFRSPCNFSVAFKKHTGMSPSQFRSRQQPFGEPNVSGNP